MDPIDPNTAPHITPRITPEPNEAVARPRDSVVAILSALGVVVVLLSVLVPIDGRPHRSICKHHQKQIVLSLVLYRDSHGRGVDFPPFGGSALLVHLYLVGVNTEADLFICPSSGDDNSRVRFSTAPGQSDQATSYAALSDPRRFWTPGLAAGASSSPVMSDDGTPVGGALFNHQEACVVGFADGHVEEVPIESLGGATDVGVPGTLLESLAN